MASYGRQQDAGCGHKTGSICRPADSMIGVQERSRLAGSAMSPVTCTAPNASPLPAYPSSVGPSPGPHPSLIMEDKVVGTGNLHQYGRGVQYYRDGGHLVVFD